MKIFNNIWCKNSGQYLNHTNSTALNISRTNTHTHTHTHIYIPRFKLQPTNTKINLSYSYRPSPYRAVNTLHLCHKTSQLMVHWKIIAVCSEIHTKHTKVLCGQNVELLNVKLAVRRFMCISRL